jgi:hypothetical protein
MGVEKKFWQDPEIVLVGSVAEIVKNGVGKTVILDGDPGEPNKNPQQDS